MLVSFLLPGRITDDAADTVTITAAANGPSQPFLPHGDTPTVPPYDSEGARGLRPSYMKHTQDRQHVPHSVFIWFSHVLPVAALMKEHKFMTITEFVFIGTSSYIVYK
jgi:hypothetical protein